MKRGATAIATAAVIGLSAPPAGNAAQLAADLSRDTVAITTGFVGDKVIFFGAADGPGHILIVVEGPPKDTIVRRKSRVSGIWINRDSVTFRDAPSFYALAASGPPDKIVSPHAARKFRIGLDNLELPAVRNGAAPVSEGEANRFREALVRNQQRAGLFRPKIAKVILPATGVRLFRTEIFFPSNVPTGVYPGPVPAAAGRLRHPAVRAPAPGQQGRSQRPGLSFRPPKFDLVRYRCDRSGGGRRMGRQLGVRTEMTRPVAISLGGLRGAA